MTTDRSPLKRFEEAIGLNTSTPASPTRVNTGSPTPAVPQQAAPGPAPTAPTPKEIEDRFREFTQALVADKADQERTRQSGPVAKALDVLDFATSGNTFLDRVSGGRIKLDKLDTFLPDQIDYAIYKGLDYVANPLTIAALPFAAVTLPARFAASPLARLGMSLAAEVGLSAAGDVASRVTADSIPDRAPDWVKVAVPLAAGVATAAGAAGGINRSLRGLNEAQIRNVASDAIRKEAQAAGLTHTPLLHDLNDLVDGLNMQKTAVGRWFAEHSTIDPVAGEATRAGQLYHGLIRQEATGDAAAALSLAGALPEGMSGFRIVGDQIDNIPRAKGKHWTEVFSDDNAPSKYGFDAKQTQQWTTWREIMDDGEQLAKHYGLNIPAKDADGLYYAPRRTKGNPNGTWDPPLDENLKPVYDYVVRAAGDGLAFAGPEDTALLHLTARYRAAARSQFDSEVGRMLVSNSKAYDSTGRAPALKSAYEQASTDAITANRRFGAYTAYVRKLQNQLEEATVSGNGSRQVELAIKLMDARKKLTTVLAPAVAKTSEARNKARTALQTDYKRFRTQSRTALPGRLFGAQYGDDEIDVVKWKGKFIPAEQGERLAKWFDMQRGTLIHDRQSPIVRGVRDVADAVRTASASLDWSMPFVQGLPLLANDPKAWANMAFQSYKAFFRPGALNRYIEANYWDLQQMIVNGRVPAGDVEMFKGLARGGLLDRAGRAAEKTAATRVGKKIIGTPYRASERSYNMGLLVARHKLWKNFKEIEGLSDEQAGKLVRNMTGGLDTATMGISGAQRAVESLLFFSPKLFRSTGALMADAARPWTPTGAQAAHNVLKLTGSAAGLFAIASMGIGLGNGESDQQIDERVRQTLQPWNGGKFLGVRYDDEYYGIGGQTRAFTQFIASSIVGGTDSVGLTNETDSENPLFNLMYQTGKLLESRGSPFTRAVEAGVEAATQEKLNLLPFDQIDNVPDLALYVGKSALPFLVQGALESGSDAVRRGEDPFDPTQYTSGIADLLGLRANPVTVFDRRNDLAISEYGSRWSDLTPEQKALLRQENADLFTEIDKHGDLEQVKYNELRNASNERTTATLQMIAQKQYPDLKTRRQEIEDLLRARAIEQRAYRESAGMEDPPPTTFAGRVLAAYYHMYDLARMNPSDPNSPLDFDVLDQLQGTLQAEIDAQVFGSPSEARAVLAQRAGFQLPPELQWYTENKKVIAEAGYWKAADAAFEKYAPGLVRDPRFSDVGSYGELKARLMQLAEQGDQAAAAFGSRYQKRMEAEASAVHERMRKANPALDEALYENGYTTRRLRAPFVP